MQAAGYKEFYMKCKLLLSALISAACLNATASEVTLYGVIDEAVTVTKHKGESAVVKMDNGIYAGSRFGLRGVEDLGNGNSVGFILEQGFNADDGSEAYAGKAFSREALLQVKGKWGELAFGRAGGLSSDCGTYTILHGGALWTSYYTDGNLASAFIVSDRMDNLVVYRSPEFSGMSITAMYSNGTGLNSEGEDNQKWSKNSHYYGIGLDYSHNETIFSVIWELLDNKDLGAKSTQLFTLGGQQGFGDWTFWAGYQYAHNSQMLPGWNYATQGRKGVSQHAVTAAVGRNAWGGEWKFEGNYAHGKSNHSGKKYNIWSAGTAYEYPVSKRTLTYVYGGYGKANKLLNTDEYKSAFNSWTVCLGVSHSF